MIFPKFSSAKCLPVLEFGYGYKYGHITKVQEHGQTLATPPPHPIKKIHGGGGGFYMHNQIKVAFYFSPFQHMPESAIHFNRSVCLYSAGKGSEEFGRDRTKKPERGKETKEEK